MSSSDKKGSNLKNPMSVQKMRVEKLMKNPDKPITIPGKREEKLPRVFNPPEFYRNVWGSSAGAGSGDFHLYRCIRRREYARQRFLDVKEEKEILNDEFAKRLEENKQKADAKTAKKRAKRLKKKAKQKQKKPKTQNPGSNNESKSDTEDDDEDSDSDADEDSAHEQSSEQHSNTRVVRQTDVQSNEEEDSRGGTSSEQDVSRDSFPGMQPQAGQLDNSAGKDSADRMQPLESHESKNVNLDASEAHSMSEVKQLSSDPCDKYDDSSMSRTAGERAEDKCNNDR